MAGMTRGDRNHAEARLIAPYPDAACLPAERRNLVLGERRMPVDVGHLGEEFEDIGSFVGR